MYKRQVYNFRNSTRTPWLVEISGDKILTAKVGSTDAPRSFDTATQFNKFAAGRPRSEQYFVLVAKPSGIDGFRDIRAYLSIQSMDTGVELIAEDQVAVDPVKGVGF